MTEDGFRQEVLRRLTSVEDEVGDLKKRQIASEQRDAVADVHRINVETRLSSIEDTLKWLVRLIIGALIGAVVAYALAGGFNLVP